MNEKRYFLKFEWGYREMTFEFETIQEATDFADTWFNAKINSTDDDEITAKIGMYYDKPVKADSEETANEKED